MVLTPEYDSYLISLDQLRESGIIYHNNPSTITLMRGDKTSAIPKEAINSLPSIWLYLFKSYKPLVK